MQRIQLFARTHKKLCWLLGASLFALVLGAWAAWFALVYLSPNQVFQRMLLGTLTTTSYAREISASGEKGTQIDSGTVTLIGDATAQTNIMVSNDSASIEADVISTLTSDQVRMQQSDDATSASTWQTQDTPGQLNQSLSQVLLFNTYFPRANMTIENAQRIRDFANDYTVFSYSQQQVTRRWSGGRLLYTYSVQVQPQTYAQYLKLAATAMGLESLTEDIDPATYATTSSIALTVSVDALSGRIMAVDQSGSETTITERYAGYGSIGL